MSKLGMVRIGQDEEVTDVSASVEVGVNIRKHAEAVIDCDDAFPLMYHGMLLWIDDNALVEMYPRTGIHPRLNIKASILAGHGVYGNVLLSGSDLKDPFALERAARTLAQPGRSTYLKRAVASEILGVVADLSVTA